MAEYINVEKPFLEKLRQLGWQELCKLDEQNEDLTESDHIFINLQLFNNVH
jgi:hypothetical protein